MNQSNPVRWTRIAHSPRQRIRQPAALSDESDSFVSDNYVALNSSTRVLRGDTAELGGGGASHREVADMLRTLAQYCGSTALALSMHQHLVAATIGSGGAARAVSRCSRTSPKNSWCSSVPARATGSRPTGR
jgi:hypothetical protein